MNAPFPDTQEGINSYLMTQLEDCKRRIATLESDAKKRVEWKASRTADPLGIVTPKVVTEPYLCDVCRHQCYAPVWNNGHVFCNNVCCLSWIKEHS